MRRLTALCAAAALVLTACGTDGTTADDPPAATTDAAEPAAPATDAATESGPEPGNGPTVEVLDAGAEPRHPMRLNPEEGQEATMRMRMDMAMEMMVDGQPEPTADIPSTIMTMHAVVDQVTADTIRTVVTYQGVELDGQDPGGMQELLDTLEGLSGTVTTTRTGAFVEGGFSTAGIHPFLQEMVQSFDQQLSALAIPMPEEDLGVGARWRVTTQFDVGGLTTQMTADYHLAAFDGVSYELETTVAQALIPGFMDGGARVLEGGGSGDGTVSGRLDFPFAFDGTSSADTTMLFEVEGAQGTHVIEQRQVIQMTMSGTS